MKAFITDGTKSVPLSQLRPSAWTPTDDLDLISAGDASVPTLWRSLPVLYRAVDIRALAVSRMPFALLDDSKQDITSDDQSAPIVQRIRSMLYLTEAALSLVGAAYFELATNKAGRNLTPMWLAPQTVRPYIDPMLGLQYFDRTGPYYKRLEIEECLYTWRPNPLGEIGAGPAPAASVLMAAGLLRNLDLFAAGFFARGAIKVTLLTVDGNPPPQEMKKLEDWWNRLIGGVRSAFRSIAIKSNIKPVVIGSGLEETTAPELTTLKREDIAAGMGVPMSLMFSDPLAGGTASAERLNFYDFVVVPECESIIGPAFNEQFFSRIGLQIKFLPEKLEVYQTAELEKAQAISNLVGQPVLTVDEAREMLGKGPMPQQQQPAPTEQSAETPMLPDQQQESSLLLPGSIDDIELRSADIERWQRKALKRIRAGKSALCDFESDYIDDDEAALIHDGLLHAVDTDSVKAAFSPAPPGAGLSADERVVYDRLVNVFGKAAKATATTIRNGQQPDISALTGEIRAALTTAVTEAVNVTLASLAAEFGPVFDTPLVGQNIAARYLTEYLQGIEETTRKAVESAVMAYRATPGMGQDDLIAVLRGAFGARRAELIAISSITEAAAQATADYQERIAAAGIQMERIWRTNNDERVCVVCGPLNGKATDQLPPAHPRCRCAVTLRLRK